jgi:hypothetical protein
MQRSYLAIYGNGNDRGFSNRMKIRTTQEENLVHFDLTTMDFPLNSNDLNKLQSSRGRVFRFTFKLSDDQKDVLEMSQTLFYARLKKTNIGNLIEPQYESKIVLRQFDDQLLQRNCTRIQD